MLCPLWLTATPSTRNVISTCRSDLPCPLTWNTTCAGPRVILDWLLNMLDVRSAMVSTRSWFQLCNNMFIEEAGVDVSGSFAKRAPILCTARYHKGAGWVYVNDQIRLHFSIVVCGYEGGGCCPGPKPLLSNLLGLSHGTLADPQCFRRRAEKRPRGVAAVVMDVYIGAVLKMLRQLKAAAFALAVADPFSCAGAC